MHLAIKEAFARTGKTKGGLAKALGCRNSRVTEILQGVRAIRAAELPVIIKYFGLDLVPVVGRVGAGGAVEAYDQGEQRSVKLTYFDAFAALSEGPLQAYEVSGDSLMPRYSDGDTVVVREAKEKAFAKYFEDYQEAIVRCADGRMWLRWLQPSNGAAKLTTINSRAITGRVVWVGEICFTVRGHQRRKRQRR